MINTNLLKQVLKALEIKDSINEDSISDFLNKFQLYEKDFSSIDYSYLIEIREYKIGFTNRLMFTYSKPIQELEIFIEVCKSVGNNILSRLENKKTSKAIALKRLHQKSSLISSEIVYLIKGGYPAAALSRWRTLLETSVIALFLAQNDDSLSERYLDYEIIDTRKEMNNYKDNCSLLGFEKISKEKEEKIEQKYQSILNKYGNEFRNDNGWASDILKKKKPNLHDLMDYVDLQYIKPFYKFSNNHIHCGAKSLMYNLGFIDGVYDDNTISAPSNIGFTDPAQLCMLSFFNSTISFLILSPNKEDLTVVLSLYNKINSIAKLFSDVESKIIDDEIKNSNITEG